MRISVIIPALDESENIEAAIATARQYAGAEIIVCDGGSRDGTADIASSCGAKTLCTGRGRACQMNAGAAIASGDALLFLHADTRLPKDYGELIRKALTPSPSNPSPTLRLRSGHAPGGGRKEVVAGAFTLSIGSPLKGLRIIEWLADFRTKWMLMPYGDQGIFIRADVFRDLGGFAEMPIMEDFELMRRVKKSGRIVILPEKAVTSARRWVRTGVLKTTIINQLIILGYFAGVKPERLARLYR